MSFALPELSFVMLPVGVDGWTPTRERTRAARLEKELKKSAESDAPGASKRAIEYEQQAAAMEDRMRDVLLENAALQRKV